MLANVRVLDLSPNIAGQYAARLFATYGADVIKVEPPEGDPLRRVVPRIGNGPDGGILFNYLNAGKRSVVVDQAAKEGAERLAPLLRSADVVFESGQPGIATAPAPDLDGLAAERPALVICSITPYGRFGPRAGWKATSLTAFASGGQMMLTGEPERQPLKTAGHQAYYQAGLHGFGSALTALYCAHRTGRGGRIDISVQEAQAVALEGAGPASMARGVDSERMGNQLHAALAMYQCADGYVSVAALQRQMKALFACIGHSELYRDDRFATPAARRANNDLLRALILAWTLDHTGEEIVAEAKRHDAPFCRILTPAEVLEWAPLKEAGFWREVEHPVLGRHPLPAGPFALDGDRGTAAPAPRLGEHTAEVLEALPLEEARRVAPVREQAAGQLSQPAARSPAPLQGVRVLDLTAVWSGPFAARLLAEMGADVIKLEGPQTPDAVRLLVSTNLGDGGYNRVPYFNEYNRRKRAIAVDLGHAQGRQAFLELVACADVVIENWRADVLDRLGLGYEVLRAINPQIIVVSMPGFAAQGEEALLPGYGSLIESMAGLVSLQGYEGGQPQKSGVSYGDPVAGVTAAAATVLALLKRDETGQGSRVIVPQRDTIIGLIGEYLLGEALDPHAVERTGNRDPRFCPHNVYRARDDSGRMQATVSGEVIREFHDTWLAIHVEDDAGWCALRRAVGDPRLEAAALATLAGRKAHEQEIDDVIGDWVRERDPLEAAELLQRAGVAAAPVLSPLMLVHDAHLAARGFYTSCDHPEFGRHTCTVPNWRLEGHFSGESTPAPCFGQHTHEVFSELVGLRPGRLQRLYEDGVVADVPREA